jgi:hypothetical protein
VFLGQIGSKMAIEKRFYPESDLNEGFEKFSNGHFDSNQGFEKFSNGHFDLNQAIEKFSNGHFDLNRALEKFSNGPAAPRGGIYAVLTLTY